MFFKMKSLDDNYDLYVKTNVLLLDDVFENFRGLCKQFYDIDTITLLTSPGLSCQVCLIKTWVELELLTDINMLLFIEKNIRGGTSQIIQKFVLVPNILVPNHNSNELPSNILYWYVNNAYG